MQEKKLPKKSKLITCPTCKSLTEYSLENAYRPFCSERCKMIDLGDWANENYRIPEKTPSKDINE